MTGRLLEWLDHRTGYRSLRRHLLEEPLPKGTGWAFTTGSAVMFLLGIQLVTGIGLTMYYVPAPLLAYDSVRYITDTLAYGWLLRGLHYWGSTFIVLAAAIHMLRVFFFGSFKAPREVTWITGVVLFLLILAFSLSGYLLPWDQKAYWATTVTINIARSSPVIGEYLADVMRGGSHLGALTLGRWYSAHVFLLPAALILFVVAHIALMRRHGISGPIKVQPGPPLPFYPWHAIKDTVVMAAVFALLVTLAMIWPAHLDEIANPADASYVPRPDWYFLSLFELLKYFPGPFEPLATQVIPGLIVGFFMALPFLDRGGDRRPFSRGRLPVTLAVLIIGGGIVALTMKGLIDSPAKYDPNDWGPRAIAGHQLVTAPDNKCATCHVSGGSAAALAITRITKDEEWLLSHMADPVAIAPGVRSEGDPAPPPHMTRFQSQSVIAYLRRIRAGATPPQLEEGDRQAANTFSNMCAGCHKIAGEGGESAPDLSHVGLRRDAAGIKRIIRDPTTEFPDTMMPPYGERLSEEQIDALVQYLSKRQAGG
ncbi:MAG TPA: cytochrome b N-terminal domain-containing protein [Vicinamibacterales bacterium]|nr:cytochrome b N-terminal domain-containing protein [Vicinamibacterales bacterium]